MAAVLLSLMLLSCGGPDQTVAQEPGNELQGGAFVSVSVVGADGEPALVEGTRVSLTFDDDSMTWEAGCNHIGGAVSVARGVLDVADEVSTTDMGCARELQAQDDWLTDFFTKDPQWRLTDDALVVTDGSIRMTFE